MDKYHLVDPFTILRHSSISVLTATAALSGYLFWLQEVTQAYLQSDEKLMHVIYIRKA